MIDSCTAKEGREGGREGEEGKRTLSSSPLNRSRSSTSTGTTRARAAASGRRSSRQTSFASVYPEVLRAWAAVMTACSLSTLGLTASLWRRASQLFYQEQNIR